MSTIPGGFFSGFGLTAATGVIATESKIPPPRLSSSLFEFLLRCFTVVANKMREARTTRTAAIPIPMLKLFLDNISSLSGGLLSDSDVNLFSSYSIAPRLLGTLVGRLVGTLVGTTLVGTLVAKLVGKLVGKYVGMSVLGTPEGEELSALEGNMLGSDEGDFEGEEVGSLDGRLDGGADVTYDGDMLGSADGEVLEVADGYVEGLVEGVDEKLTVGVV